MKINPKVIAKELTGADWSPDERADAKIAAKAFVLHQKAKSLDPELAPMISSMLDEASEWAEMPIKNHAMGPLQVTQGLRSSLKSIQQIRGEFEGENQKRVDALLDEIALFIREKDNLVKRKALRS